MLRERSYKPEPDEFRLKHLALRLVLGGAALTTGLEWAWGQSVFVTLFSVTVGVSAVLWLAFHPARPRWDFAGFVYSMLFAGYGLGFVLSPWILYFARAYNMHVPSDAPTTLPGTILRSLGGVLGISIWFLYFWKQVRSFIASLDDEGWNTPVRRFLDS